MAQISGARVSLGARSVQALLPKTEKAMETERHTTRRFAFSLPVETRGRADSIRNQLKEEPKTFPPRASTLFVKKLICLDSCFMPR